MRPEEVNALGDLAGEAVAGLATQVREVHEGIAERVFGSLGLVGDLLVLRPSAWSHGRGERVRFRVEQYSHLGGGTHFDLLNHPAIYEQIKRWLTAGRALPAPAV